MRLSGAAQESQVRDVHAAAAVRVSKTGRCRTLGKKSGVSHEAWQIFAPRIGKASRTLPFFCRITGRRSYWLWEQ